MHFLKNFNNHSQYEAYIAGGAIRPNVSTCIEELHVHYNPIPHDYTKDYFTIESLENNNEIGWYCDTSYDYIDDEPICATIQYSTDGGSTWSSYTPTVLNETHVIATLNRRGKLLLKATVKSWTSDSEGGIFGKLASTKTVNVEGNIMSLLYGDDFDDKLNLPDYQDGGHDTFRYFFSTTGYYQEFEPFKIVSAKNLQMPATGLTNSCYAAMFLGSSIVEPPLVLPATSLTTDCYFRMFSQCESLVKSPELPATSLSDGSYNQMFNDCMSLNQVKCLATDISAYSCTYQWLMGTASSGTFTKAASMSSWTTGSSGIPDGWTVTDA